jgi:hypothetical protein
MQNPEPTQNEFGEDLEADAFEFETSDMETGVESPEGMPEGAIGDAISALSAKQLGAHMGVLAHRQQSGRWVRRDDTVVLFGI